VGARALGEGKGEGKVGQCSKERASGGTRPGAQALGAHQHTFYSHFKTRFKQKFRQK